MSHPSCRALDIGSIKDTPVRVRPAYLAFLLAMATALALYEVAITELLVTRLWASASSGTCGRQRAGRQNLLYEP